MSSWFNRFFWRFPFNASESYFLSVLAEPLSAEKSRSYLSASFVIDVEQMLRA